MKSTLTVSSELWNECGNCGILDALTWQVFGSCGKLNASFLRYLDEVFG